MGADDDSGAGTARGMRKGGLDPHASGARRARLVLMLLPLLLVSLIMCRPYYDSYSDDHAAPRFERGTAASMGFQRRSQTPAARFGRERNSKPGASFATREVVVLPSRLDGDARRESALGGAGGVDPYRRSFGGAAEDFATPMKRSSVPRRARAGGDDDDSAEDLQLQRLRGALPANSWARDETRSAERGAWPRADAALERGAGWGAADKAWKQPAERRSGGGWFS